MNKTNNYIVLARKYRPSKLSEIIGQDETCKIIEGSIKLNRTAHAFLFSGTRGVGKTTLARILAKIVNCKNLEKEIVEPCGNCENCKSIENGNNMDVVEIDAASRTGVSDVREIIDNVNYKPVTSKKKIFIIDEVHMLSKAAFNALLKTLEEPPPDVIFIFATTETDKIPLTIISRCQQFQLKRVDTEVISKYLKIITEKECVKIDIQGFNLIAQAAEGSVRDALSILDNVLTRGNPIKIETIRDVLGLSDNNLTLELFMSLLDGDVRKSFDIFEDLYKKGISIKMLSQKLMDMTYHTMRIKIKLDEKNNILDSKTLDTLKSASEKYPIDFLTRFWELMQKYINEIQRCFDEKQFFEVSIMRLCYVNLIPTPFELLEESNKEKFEHKNVNETNFKKNESTPTELRTNISNEYKKNNNQNNLAVKSEIQTVENIEIDSKDKAELNSMLKFKSLIDQIEDQSEMMVSYHLKNSFKLVRLTENENVREIELENVSNNNDVKKILWNASKLLNKVTKERWIISLSVRKGLKTVKEYEEEIELQEIMKVKKIDFVKKILEIIPSSEIVSVRELDNTKISKKRENYE